MKKNEVWCEHKEEREKIKKDRENSLEQHSEHSDDISGLHRESQRLRTKYTESQRLRTNGIWKSVAKSESKINAKNNWLTE